MLLMLRSLMHLPGTEPVEVPRNVSDVTWCYAPFCPFKLFNSILHVNFHYGDCTPCLNAY